MFGGLGIPTRGSKFGRRVIALSTTTLNKRRGARVEGTHTTKGAFVLRPHMLMRIVAPDLTGFQLRPYVDPSVRPPPAGGRVPPLQ